MFFLRNLLILTIRLKTGFLAALKKPKISNVIYMQNMIIKSQCLTTMYVAVIFEGGILEVMTID
jgi:hypothetical protein